MTGRSELVPTVGELARLREVAAGRARPDLIVRGGWVQSPGSEEWLERDILIAGRHIATLTPWQHVADPLEEIDARGQYVVPTFIDAHLHVEYTNLTPGELARLSVARGTATVLTDPNAAANVWGERGMDFMLRTGTPFHIFQQVTPTTPVSLELEHGGAVITEEAVRERVGHDDAVTLGEGNPFDFGEVSNGRYQRTLAAGRRITGHTASQQEEALWSYLAAGVGDDHNASTIDDALERVRLGAMITIMGSSLADNTVSLFSDLDRIAPALRHMSFCADDKHALDLSTEGHIDHHVRQAIRLGVDPQLAYRMATTIPARYYRLDQLLGILAPSRLADLQLIPDLADVRPSLVVVAGQVVARNGVAVFANDDVIPDWVLDSIRLPEQLPSDIFAVSARDDSAPQASSTASVRAMEMYDGYFKRAITAELPVIDGLVMADASQDLLKVAVVDRHHASGEAGVGFVRGFGLREGAIAISMNCPNMNIAVVGADDASMHRAVEKLRAMGGGFVTVAGGEVIARVALPVGGMMSAAPFEQTAAALAHAHAATRDLGCMLVSPFIILSFVGLYVVPDLGLTERGLIDTTSQSFVPLVLPSRVDRCGHPHIDAQ